MQQFTREKTFFADRVRLDLVCDNFRNIVYLELIEFVDNAYYSGRKIKSIEVTVEFNIETHIIDDAFNTCVERIKHVNSKQSFEIFTKLLCLNNNKPR